jgi:hypothetical protein
MIARQQSRRLPIPSLVRTIWCNLAMSSRYAPKMAECCDELVTPKQLSISRAWRGCSLPAVLCEILHDDGTMARLPELMDFRKKHGLRICTIQSLIAHRRLTEKLVEAEQIVKLPTDYGDFDLHLYRSTLDGAHHLALVKGKISKTRPTLVRVHSECLTGDVFGSRRCDCGHQLQAALRQISEEGNGVLLYMRQEGTRNWSGGEDSRLQVTGGRARYRGGECEARFRDGPCVIMA